VAVARRVGEPIKVPEEIDVLEEDGKVIHVLQINVRVDVTEIKERIELLKPTWERMAHAIKVEAQDLEERWET
jgi:hypothetical protein